MILQKSVLNWELMENFIYRVGDNKHTGWVRIIALSPDNLRLFHVVVGVGDGHNVAPVHIVAHGGALALVDGCRGRTWNNMRLE